MIGLMMKGNVLHFIVYNYYIWGSASPVLEDQYDSDCNQDSHDGHKEHEAQDSTHSHAHNHHHSDSRLWVLRI